MWHQGQQHCDLNKDLGKTNSHLSSFGDLHYLIAFLHLFFYNILWSSYPL